MTRREMLLLGDGRLDRVRGEIRDVRSAQFRRLTEQCAWYPGQVPPSEHPAASITYFGYAAANLSLAYLLTGQRHYLDEARRWIFTAVGYPHWGKAHMPDHDLDAGWLLHGLGLAYDWLQDELEPEERERLREKLMLQGRRMYDHAVASEGTWWSSSYWQNHNWICHTGLATAGYALAAECPEATAWTTRVKDNFATVLELLPEDGSNCEGVVYWRYGVPWIVTYLDLLEHAEGADWFARSPYLRDTFWYRLYQAAPNLEEIVNHGDCHDRRSGHSVALYYKLAAKYRIPQAQWLANVVAERFFWREAYASGVKPGVMPEAFLELLWYDPTVVAAGPADLPPQRYFPDLGLVVARTSWDADATMLSFKASPGGGHKAWETSHRIRRERGWETLNAGHHHPDANSFVLISDGEFLAIDEGYNNEKQAACHNLVLVDGRGFAGEGGYHVYRDLDEGHVARIRECSFDATAGVTVAVGESAPMCPPELGVGQVERRIEFAPTGRVEIHDVLAADAPRRWTWLLQSDHPAEHLGGRRYLIQNGQAQLVVTVVMPADVEVEITTTAVHANPTSSTPSLAIDRTQATLALHSGPRDQCEFRIVLEPEPSWDEKSSERGAARS